MGKIIVYNSKMEDYSSEPNNFPIYRPHPLGNPFTHNGKRSNLAKMSFSTRDEAIDAYELYFKQMYGKKKEFTEAFDEIYEHYKNGEDVYLQCFCKPERCHGDIIAKELQKRLILEKREQAYAKRESNAERQVISVGDNRDRNSL